MFVNEDWRLSTIMFLTLLLLVTAFEPLAVSEKDGKFFFCFLFNVFSRNSNNNNNDNNYNKA